MVGGGFIGLELAEQLRHRGVPVMLVERGPSVLGGAADPEMVYALHEELRRGMGIDLRLNSSVSAFETDAGGSLMAVLDDVAHSRIPCRLAVLGVGVRPETSLAKKAGLKLGTTGGILVSDQMRTSDPSVYAVGDAIEVHDFVSGQPALIALAGPANRQGRIAAEVMLGRSESRYKNLATQGTAIVQVGTLTFGCVGLSETALLRKQIPYTKIYVLPNDHAGYYPGASQMTLKLLFSPNGVDGSKGGKILGAQAVGKNGIDKRIDVLAVAQRSGLSVYDLEELELSYAPPYGSAKDAVNFAGFVAANVLRGDMTLWEPEEIEKNGAPQSSDAASSSSSQPPFLLDVRSMKENSSGSIPGSICIPVDSLRSRVAELPTDRELLLFCQVGARGYIAARMLSQMGFKVRNLSGGYRRYVMWKETRPAARL